MFKRGKVWIVPSDDIMQPLYFKQVNEGVAHLTALQEFADKFQLGMKFTLDDYQEAPIDIAGRGNLVIKSDDDSKVLLFYIPKAVTDRQLEFFLNNEMDFNSSYSKIGAFFLEDNEVKMERGILEIRKLLNTKNKKNYIKK